MKGHTFYPLFLDISNRLSIVIGGGKVGERKVRTLLKFNGKVKVISPEITKGLLRLWEKGKIEIVKKAYEEGDIEGAFLVFAATDNMALNQRIKREAECKGILVNVVDNPKFCDFYVPAIVKKHYVTVAISTSGVAPLGSKMIRKELEKKLGQEYEKYVKILKVFKTQLIKKVKDPKTRKRIMKELGKKSLEEVIEKGPKGLMELMKVIP